MDSSFSFINAKIKILSYVVPVCEDAACGYEAMDGVAHGPDQDPELVPPIDRLLLEAEDHWPEVVVVSEVVPMLGPVEVFLVCCLDHACQLEAPVLTPMLLYDGFFTTIVGFLNNWKTLGSLVLLPSFGILNGVK